MKVGATEFLGTDTQMSLVCRRGSSGRCSLIQSCLEEVCLEPGLLSWAEELPSWDPMAFSSGLWGPCVHMSRAFSQRCFSTTGSLGAIQKMTRVRVVDNSALGNTPYHRPPRCIHVYNKNGVGKVGDRILLAIKGQKKKALIVGHCMPGPTMTPRFDSNNVVLIEDNGNPVGTRIKTPIPTSLRQREGEFSKVLAIAQNFV
ncbi:39S ribosomal protein L14, mitochondrial isoform X1 [Bos indicus x Bos taurus]|uniref:Large ribosomal subunit protein uL14m n=1 Tax=Bos indicus x Bos taurus TaxID=30522 RepID=A0A4W2H5I5_BOBOX|nr:39S ribosomal protein L14, mitochondrial isoform X1 [Bos indicus x Bos taurus]